MRNYKESSIITKRNQIRLEILQKEAQKYIQFLNFTSKKESKIKLNPEFIKNQEEMKEEFEKKSSEEKPLFISNQIEKLKDLGSKIKNKIVDFQKHKELKELEFIKLEQEIAHFEVLIEKLKEENRLLRQELELLIEHKKNESNILSMKKEQKDLKEKIDEIKNKDKTSFEERKERKPLKANKITYDNSHEQER